MIMEFMLLFSVPTAGSILILEMRANKSAIGTEFRLRIHKATSLQTIESLTNKAWYSDALPT